MNDWLPDYYDDILNYLKSTEGNNRPTLYIRTKQPYFNEGMRSELINWLHEVNCCFKFQSRTFFCAINYLDRFLSIANPVPHQYAQLVGITCLFISHKYNELQHFNIKYFSKVTDNAFKPSDIVQMELIVSTTLKFSFSAILPDDFLMPFIKAVGEENNQKLIHLSSFIAEATVQHYDSLRLKSSEISASAVVLGLFNLDLKTWSPELEDVCGLDWDSLNPSVRYIQKIHEFAFNNSDSKICSCNGKFSAVDYNFVSTIPPRDINLLKKG